MSYGGVSSGREISPRKKIVVTILISVIFAWFFYSSYTGAFVEAQKENDKSSNISLAD